MQEEDPFEVFDAPQRPYPPATETPPSKRQHLDQPLDLPEEHTDSEHEDAAKRLENITIETIREETGCIHEVYFPAGYQRTPFTGEPLAKKYPFKLDPFQQKAVHAI